MEGGRRIDWSSAPVDYLSIFPNIRVKTILISDGGTFATRERAINWAPGTRCSLKA